MNKGQKLGVFLDHLQEGSRWGPGGPGESPSLATEGWVTLGSSLLLSEPQLLWL